MCAQRYLSPSDSSDRQLLAIKLSLLSRSYASRLAPPCWLPGDASLTPTAEHVRQEGTGGHT